MGTILQLWTAPSCQAGAVALGALRPVSAQVAESTSAAPSLRLVVTADTATAASVQDGTCVRELSPARGERWWFVASTTDSDGDAGLVTMQCGPLRQLLTMRGLVRDDDVFRFTPGRRTVADLLDTYVLTNLTADGLPWLSRGTIDVDGDIDIGTLTRTTRAAVLTEIEKASGASAVLRGLYTGTTLTGFAIDVLRDPAASRPVLPLAVGPQLAGLTRTREAIRAATVVLPFDTQDRPLEQPVWRIASITGAGPAWLTLRDPLAEASDATRWPIREDDQLVGALIRQEVGTTSEITDSRAIDSAVQVTTLGTLAVGQWVTITATDGGPVTEVESPSGVLSARGRLVGQANAKERDARRNQARNGALSEWTGLTTCVGWTADNVDPSRYPRNSLTSIAGATAERRTLSGSVYLDITVAGAPPNFVFLKGEWLSYQGETQVGVTTQMDSSGGGVLPLLVPRQIFTAGFTALALRGTARPRRPAALPDDGTAADAPVAFLYEQSNNFAYPPTGTTHSLISPAVSVLPYGDRDTVWGETAWTYVTGTTAQAQNLDASSNPTNDAALVTQRNYPAMALLKAGTVASHALVTPNIPAGATGNAVLSCSTQLTAATSMTLAAYPGSFACFSFLRYASMWLDTAAGTGLMGRQASSGSNVLWHYAQDVLGGLAAGVRYVVRGAALAALEQEFGAVALGQQVRLRAPRLNVAVTVRVVKLDYDLSRPGSAALELGAVIPRLSAVTVSL
jgi:hypothetical protein